MTRNAVLRLTLVTGLLSLSTGCAALLISAGAAGGYAVSRDSIRNYLDLPLDQVYGASREVIGELGLVTAEDARRGLIKATVQNANVTVTVKRVSEQSVELKVKARNKFLWPKIDVAHTVYNRILERLP